MSALARVRRSVTRLRPSTDALVAGLAGVAAVSGSYAVTGPTPAFVASPVERFVSRAAPIELIVFAIQTFGDLGQKLNYLGAIVLVVGAVAVAARLALLVGDRTNNRVAAPLLTGAATWALAVAVTGAYALAFGAAIPAALVVAAPQVLTALPRLPEPISPKRRRALATIGATVGIAGAGYLSGRYVARDATTDAVPDLSGPRVDRAAIQAGLEGAAARSLDVPGMEPLVSDRFYEVDINAVDPNLDAAEWSLTVTGAVEESFTLDYDDVRAMPAENRFVTLRCVSDDLYGNKMDNALWTGVPVRRLIERANPSSDCGCVRLDAADGYFQVFPIEALRDGLLAYGMNGSPLPRGHGYPLRTLVPGHWGEINVKWLERIEFVEEHVDGYWERRGWHGTGPVVPIAKLESWEMHGDGTRVVAGHAYGGTRGVARVEVSTDDGETWSDARLSEPLGEITTPGGQPIDASDAWRQWAYEYRPPSGSHTVVVRMVDENGDVQPSERRNPFPRGASGWVSRSF